MGTVRSSEPMSTWSSRTSIGRQRRACRRRVTSCAPPGRSPPRRRRASTCGRPGRGAPQDALHARHQLVGVERLRDVVLRVLLERADLGLGGVDRAESTMIGRSAMRFTRRAELEAVHAGHHQVDDQERRPAALERGERAVRRRERSHVEALARQATREDGEQGGVVVDQQERRPKSRLHRQMPVPPPMTVTMAGPEDDDEDRGEDAARPSGRAS